MHLVGLNTQEITEWITEKGEKPFRGKQLSKWIYQKHARSWDRMSDLSKALRASLSESGALAPSECSEKITSSDGTTKFLLRLEDGQSVECVVIVQKNHLTACVSSQVGCNVGCPFCATGLSGFRRNLTAAEIVDQYLWLQDYVNQGGLKQFSKHDRISRIVFMGMGEPLLNYNAVIRAIDIFNQEIGIGKRNITISTSGIVPKIEKLMNEPIDYNLAISLHSAKSIVRDKLVPINKKHNIKKLLAAAKAYADKTKRRITFEYTMLQGYNASLEDADALIKALRGIHCHINLIAYNPVDSPFQAPPRKEIIRFQERLQQGGYPVTIRHNHGQDDMAACGQLSIKSNETPLPTL